MEMRERLAVYVVTTAALLTASCPQCRPQQIGTIDTPVQGAWAKAENGLIISWDRGISSDAKASRINIYSLQGRPLSTFEVLPLVPEAESVSIDDVSAQPQRLIAVAAVYIKRQDHSPAAVLLYLNFNGTLVSALALGPSHEVTALALDEDLNVWTVTHSSAGDDPGHSPLVVEYSATGEVVREVLTRNLFPPHEETIRESPQAGAAAAGCQGGVFWFWLPESTDLVTIRASDARILSRAHTGLPKMPGRTIWPLQIVRESSGALVAELHVEEPGPKPRGSLAYYAWSPQSESWSPFNPEPCTLHRLIGTDGNKLIYLRFYAASTICSFSRP